MHIKADIKPFVLLIPLLLLGCGEKKSPPPQPETQASKQAAPAMVKPPEEPVEEEIPVYVYSGDRFRDPFTEVGQSAVYQPDAIFNPQQAKVVAIIHSPRIKSAAIKISGTGSYYVTGSRIFDIMGKTVKGYSAKIYLEKVVITGEADDVFNLYLRESDQPEEEKSL